MACWFARLAAVMPSRTPRDADLERLAVKHVERASATRAASCFTRSRERAHCAELRDGTALVVAGCVISVVIALSLSIGLSLGLLGGGGSILTVPILRYVAGMAPQAAIASSLFVVGVASVVGVVTHARAGRVRWRTAAMFGTAGMAGAYAGGQLSSLIPGRALLILFGVMMTATAIAMLRARRDLVPRTGELLARKVIAQGIVVGLVTGTIGAGGGFLIVPALVLRGGLPMPFAVGTSLVVIAMQSFAGFVGHLGHASIDWPVTLAVTGAAVIGCLVGGGLVERLAPATLRRGFGLFVLAMSGLVLLEELI